MKQLVTIVGVAILVGGALVWANEDTAMIPIPQDHDARYDEGFCDGYNLAARISRQQVAYFVGLFDKAGIPPETEVGKTATAIQNHAKFSLPVPPLKMGLFLVGEETQIYCSADRK